MGPCAKQTVTCTLITPDGERFVGTNACANPQLKCPRALGEGYEKCKTICDQRGHAEEQALALAGEKARGRGPTSKATPGPARTVRSRCSLPASRR